MAKNLYRKNIAGDWECRATTREQQKLCRLGHLDKYDDSCQFMGHGCICNLGGLVQNDKGELVSRFQVKDNKMTEYQGTGKRRRIEIAGENYYIFVGDSHVDVTLPYENRPEHIEQRVLVNTLCKEISKLMQLRNAEDLGHKQSSTQAIQSNTQG